MAEGQPTESDIHSRRFLYQNRLRQATLIIPKTGERIKKSFTLRDPARSHDDLDGETAPLLLRRGSSSFHRRSPSRSEGLTAKSKDGFRKAYAFATSRTGQNILKCSIAYVLGSMATFVGPIRNLLGQNDGKHMVATVTVYFHPARSAGSMEEATVLALVAFIYAAFVSFTSMAVSFGFGQLDLITVGHVIVIVVFCGGGLGFVGWLKQRLGNPLVNVACSLTSLAIITVLTKEGAVQAATFSYVKILQVLKMILMGIVASTAVSLTIQPVYARKQLRKDLVTYTDLLGDVLTDVARGFLSGSEDDLEQPCAKKSASSFTSVFASMTKNLGEAKWEHYALGTEKEYWIEARLVRCMERLSQSIGGLRGAANTQFLLISKSANIGATTPATTAFGSESRRPSMTFASAVERMKILARIEEVEEEGELDGDALLESSQTLSGISSGMQTATNTADIFSLFIAHLGPPLKSLAYTLKAILDDLPFGPGPEYKIVIEPHFRSSLHEAIDLFKNARHSALAALYEHRELTRKRSIEIEADFEEVAASCGYFSSSLEDFAEDMLHYLDILEEWKLEVERQSGRRSWNWLLPWRSSVRPHTVEGLTEVDQASRINQNAAVDLSQSTQIKRQTHTPHAQVTRKKQRLAYRIWRSLAFLRREDIKYAIKVGIGATLYAMWSFIPATQPLYSRWRGEWGLLSYMLVCSMTIGASNTTGYQRFLGTCMGAACAIIAWIASHQNPFILAFFGWFVSLWCFYIIVGKGKGPMGRFILLTYNLSALYAYSLSVKDEEDDDDEGGISPEIWGIVLHRVVAVLSGCIWGIIVTRLVWPISAREKIKEGTCLLWLRMGLIWKRDPLGLLLDENKASSYMDIRESLRLQRFLSQLEALRNAATHEFELKGPFPNKSYAIILQATSRMLDAFHAMNVVITKDLKASPGEAALLKYTRKERTQLSMRISHLFSVIASSMKLEYPLNDAIPNIEFLRDRLLAKLFDFRKNGPGREAATDEDYELFYAYVLVTGQLAQDIEVIGRELEQLYGVLNEDSLKLE